MGASVNTFNLQTDFNVICVALPKSALDACILFTQSYKKILNASQFKAGGGTKI